MSPPTFYKVEVRDFGDLVILVTYSTSSSLKSTHTSIWANYIKLLKFLNLNEGDFGGDSHTKPPFNVTSAEVAIICPAQSIGQATHLTLKGSFFV